MVNRIIAQSLKSGLERFGGGSRRANADDLERLGSYPRRWFWRVVHVLLEDGPPS